MGSVELEQQNSRELLEQISQGVSAAIGDKFFTALVNSLSSVLQADLAFVGRVRPQQRSQVATVAASSFGSAVDDFTYELLGSPCADVLQQGICVYPDDVHLLYPDDRMLDEAGIRGYVGASLQDAHGNPLGILVVLYKRRVEDISQAERLVRIFAARAASELERTAQGAQLKESEKALLRSNRMLRTLSECNQSLIRSQSEPELLEVICRILVEEGGYPFVWVGYADSAAAQRLQPVARWGGDNGCLEALSEQQLGAGRGGQCVREGRYIIDSAECHREGETGSEARCACRHSITLPICNPAQGLWGALRLYADEAHTFDAGEKALLEELAADLVFGISAHRTRQALAENEAQFRSLAEDSRVGIYMIQESRVVYANPILAEIFGYSVAELVNRLRVEDLVVEAERDTVLDNLQRRFVGEVQSLHYQFTGLRKDGQPIRVEVFGSKTQINGKPAVVGTLLDVTDRERAEKRLRLMSRALEACINGIAISDLEQPDKPFVYVNPAFERITGYQAEEVIGRNGRFLLGTDLQQTEVEKLKLALRDKRSAKLVLRNYHKSGSLFWNELSLAPVIDESGTTTHYVSIFNDVTERKHYEQQLEQLSNYDALTGLANKNLLRDRLQQSLIHGERCQRTTALVMINLDRFKLLNQSLGSVVTDSMLRDLAERLQDLIRQGDTVARTGADEFAIVLHDLGNEDDIVPVVANIRAVIARPMSVGVEGVQLTASMGIGVSPRDGRFAEELMLNADAALLKAMEERDCFRFYTREMNARALDRLDLEVQLRQACEREEFVLHYQPKVDLVSGRIVGSEALIRWLHPERGMVPPFEFIPLAEETGLIREIGAWAMQEACRQTAAWRRDGHPDLTVAVNLSAHQFNDANLADQIEKALSDSGLCAEALECELTESMLMRDPEAALQTLERLNQLGVRVALDDFGTGYSSLSYLKRFPIDTLKIDRSFVKDIPDDSHDMAISKAVIALARSLELYVVAEGVETLEQLCFLREEGCPAMQGFFFSRPLPAAEFIALVSSGRGLDS